SSIVISDVIKLIGSDIIVVGKLNSDRDIPRGREIHRFLISISILFEYETAIIFINSNAVFTFFDMFGERVISLIFTVQEQLYMLLSGRISQLQSATQFRSDIIA